MQYSENYLVTTIRPVPPGSQKTTQNHKQHSRLRFYFPSRHPSIPPQLHGQPDKSKPPEQKTAKKVVTLQPFHRLFISLHCLLTNSDTVRQITKHYNIRATLRIMKPGITVRKTITATILLLLTAGVYGAVIALCNQYLRSNGLLTPMSKSILITSLAIGYWLIYRWFSKRLDMIAGKRTH